MSQSIAPASVDWPERSWALAGAGGLVGLSVWALTDVRQPDQLLSYAAATFLIVAGVAMAFVVERGRLLSAGLFAGIAALVVALTVYWNGGPDGPSSWEAWRIACAAITVAIAAPLFQAWGDAGQPRPPRLHYLDYPRVHDRAWMNVVLWAACWAFVGISFGLAHLLAELFALIGIDQLRTLMQKSWFGMMLAGAAFGAAAGVLRDRERILMTLQGVVRKVLSVLAPVLGLGLALFLLAMLFTGLSPLWDATKETTPILISTVIIALILVNATIGDSPEDEARVALLRWGALALGAAMLPLASIAAISTGLRIGQYGLTPDRIWALTFVIIACAYGVAYAVVLVRHRLGWMAPVRRANLNLALGLCGLAFLLSTPLFNFGAWSTASQLARLENGKVTVAKFDFAALRFDFGTSGKAALERLAKSGKTLEIRTAAANALKVEDRWAAREEQQQQVAADTLDKRLSIVPQKIALPPALRTRLVQYDACGSNGPCIVHYLAEADEAIMASQQCETCDTQVLRLRRDPASRNWDQFKASSEAEQQARLVRQKEERAALASGKLEIRPITRRQAFLNGKPVGEVFE